MLGTAAFNHGPVQPLPYTRVLNRFASLNQFLLILIRKCLHCQYAGSDRNIENIMLRYNFDGLFDDSRCRLFLSNSYYNANLLNHSRRNYSVLLLLHNYTVIFDRLHSNSMGNTVFVFHSQNYLIN